MKKKIESTVERLNGIEISIPENNSGSSFNFTDYHGNNYEEGQNTEAFKTIKIKTKDGKSIQNRMYQNNIEKTIDGDIKLVESGSIRGTNLKRAISKIMLEKNSDYNLTVDGEKTTGKYLGPNTMNQTQLRFLVDGKNINTDSKNIEVDIDGKNYKV